LQNLLRAQKFEWDQVEHSSHRQQASDQKLQAHTETAVKRRQPKISNLVREYNKLCDAICEEIHRRKAPARATAPESIDAKKVYALDVDDSIWQDVGLEDDDDRGEPPDWLTTDTVWGGIRAMLQLDRADEEDSCHFW
ncbi:hypothetical protein C8R45DRAFT_823597, partial [Mycena sanguinolenta]